MTTNKSFDATKPVTTRDGRKARIICTDFRGNKPIVALIDDGSYEGVVQYFSNGQFYGVPMEDEIDLINIPDKQEVYGYCSSQGFVGSWNFNSLEYCIKMKGHSEWYGIMKRTTIDGKLSAIELVHVF